jgi:HAUS augmin-like complex subunit 1
MDTAAIFSPSVARQAASTAQDWNYIDSWLSSRFKASGRGPSAPAFERNADTLKALLALANLNESADEERELLARAEGDALRQVREAREARERERREKSEGGDEDIPPSLESWKEDILTSLEAGLPKEGQTALTALASSAVELGIAEPTPETIAVGIARLQTQIFDLDQHLSRVATLQRYIDAEAQNLQELKLSENTDLRGSVDSTTQTAHENSGPQPMISFPHPSLAKENIDRSRRIKTLTQSLPELQKQVATLESTIGKADPSIEDIQRQEAEYLALAEGKKKLEAQLAAFEGLPPDIDAARAQFEGRREELRGLMTRRDAVFEGLVERETPRRPGKR